MKKKNGFTLAETLITLVIIGVVAALTIPAIISNSQNQELKTAVKKNYAVLSQALSLIIFENEASIDKCANKNDCTEYYNLLKTKLKVDKDYIGAVDGISIPKYKDGQQVLDAGGTVNNPTACSANSINKEAWTLSDGSMLISCWNTYFDQWVHVIVDVNGLKGPNKWGYDIYLIILGKYETPNYFYSDKDHEMYELGGKTYTQRLLGQ